jgi:hypothetical protein
LWQSGTADRVSLHKGEVTVRTSPGSQRLRRSDRSGEAAAWTTLGSIELQAITVLFHTLLLSMRLEGLDESAFVCLNVLARCVRGVCVED